MHRIARATVDELEVESQRLDKQIHELERRGSHQTPPEHMKATELKKMRLLAKDRLDELKRTG